MEICKHDEYIRTQEMFDDDVMKTRSIDYNDVKIRKKMSHLKRGNVQG